MLASIRGVTWFRNLGLHRVSGLRPGSFHVRRLWSESAARSIVRPYFVVLHPITYAKLTVGSIGRAAASIRFIYEGHPLAGDPSSQQPLCRLGASGSMASGVYSFGVAAGPPTETEEDGATQTASTRTLTSHKQFQLCTPTTKSASSRRMQHQQSRLLRNLEYACWGIWGARLRYGPHVEGLAPSKRGRSRGVAGLATDME